MSDFFLRLQGSTEAELPNAPASLVVSDIKNREDLSCRWLRCKVTVSYCCECDHRNYSESIQDHFSTKW